MHLPTLKTLDSLYEIRGMVSTSGAAASELARQYGAAWSTTDIEDALGHPDIDAVLITTNHDSHASLALRALQAGKHVLVEKPLSLDRPGLEALEAFFAAGGPHDRPILLTGFNRRFSEAARRAAGVLKDRRTPMVIDYRVNTGWLDPQSWVFGPRGGGRNLGEACHMYDLFCFLTDSTLSWVNAGCIGPVTAAYHRTDNFVASAGFADGSIATLTYTSLGSSTHPKERCDIYCDGRVVSIDDFRSSTLSDDKGGSRLTNHADKGHKAELESFARAVLGDGQWPIPLWHQTQATEIALQVQEILLSPAPGSDPA
jgi:predicted dehydrogenase